MGSLAIALVIAVSAAPGAQLSTQWSAVEALQPGTLVLIAFPNGQQTSGAVVQVAGDDVTIQDSGGVHVLQRRDITSVSVREPAGVSNHSAILKDALIGTAVGLGLAILMTAHYENRGRTSTAVELALGAAAAGALAGADSKPKQTYRDRMIYVRQ